MRTGWVVAVATLGLTVGLVGPVNAAAPASDGTVPAPPRPNVLLIITDDQRAGTEVGMPTVMAEIAAKGTTYPDAFVPTSWCCPSRASLLTGKFAHNTGVWDNSSTSPWGAWSAFAHGGEESDTLATRLHDAGYRTGLFGKYLNRLNLAGRTHVPPGWDEWSAFIGGNYTRYRLSSDSRPLLADRPYLTDELADQAIDFIESTPADQPFFTYFAPYAPHYPFDAGPYVGSTRAAGLLESVKTAARYPSPATNQGDMAGYPAWMQALPASDTWDDERQRAQQDLAIEEVVERQSDMLMGVDAAVARMLSALREAGRLDNTLIVFMSDNGFAWGEHRLQRKNTPYDVSVRVPLIMRLDGVLDAGVRNSGVVAANVDVHATILDIVGVEPGTIDGVSTRKSSREGLVMEATTWNYRLGTGQRLSRPAYCGYRTRDYLFIRYGTGEEELYDYTRDPHELNNVAANPVYGALKNSLESQARRSCSPTPPGFTWEGEQLPLQAPSHVGAERIGGRGVIVTWRAPGNVGTSLPRYEVYVGSTNAIPACTLGTGNVTVGMRCRVQMPQGRSRVPVTVVAVRGEERSSAQPLTVLKRSPRP